MRRSDYYRYGDYRRVTRDSDVPVRSVPVRRVDTSPLTQVTNTLLRVADNVLTNIARREDEEDRRRREEARRRREREEAQRRALVAEKADNDANVGLLRAASENQTDEAAFLKAAEGMKSGFMQTYATPDNRSEMELVWQRRVSQYQTKIIQNAVQRDFMQNGADLMKQYDSAVSNAELATRNGNADLASEFTAAAVAKAEYMYLKGYISAQDKNDLELKRNDGIDLSVHLNKLDALKSSGVAEMRAYVKMVNEDASIPTERRAALYGTLNAEISRYASASALERDRLNADVSSLASAIVKGYAVDAEKLKSVRDGLAALGDTDGLKRLENAERLVDAARAFSKLTPEEMAEDIEKTVVTPDDADFGVAVNDMKRSVLKDTVDLLEKDPVALGIKTGIVAPLGDFTPETVRNRVENIAQMRRIYGRNVPVFSNGETKSIAAAVNAFPSYRDRAAFLGQITAEIDGNDAADLFAAVAPKNPEVAQAAVISAEDPDASAMILEGADALKSGGDFAPKNNDDLNEAFYRLMPSEFSSFPPSVAASVRAAATAYYTAAAKRDGDASRILSEDRLKEAVDKVTGGVVAYDRWFFDGEDFKTIAPRRQMTSDDFEDAVAAVTDADLSGAFYYKNGGIIEISAENFRDDAVLQWVGPNRYVLIFDGAPAMHEDGKTPYVFSFPDRVLEGGG